MICNNGLYDLSLSALLLINADQQENGFHMQWWTYIMYTHFHNVYNTVTRKSDIVSGIAEQPQ